MDILKLTNDVVFKMVFCDERSNDILVNFLQAVLNLPVGELSEITIQNPVLMKAEVLEKDVVVDLKATTKSGKIIHIEMQVANHDEFSERVVYYNARTLVSQLKRGWDYSELKKVVSIIITDFEMFPGNEKYHQVFKLRNEDTDLVISDAMEINVLELPKTPKESSNELELWMRLFKAQRKEELDMLAQQSQYIKNAVVRLRELSADEESRMLAEDREQAIAIKKAQIAFAEKQGIKQGIEKGIEQGIEKGIEQGIEKGIEKGIEQGIEKGIEQGIEKGIEQGIEKGIKQGIEKGIEKIVTHMLQKGKALEEIADDTGLTVAQIIELKKDTKTKAQ